MKTTRTAILAFALGTAVGFSLTKAFSKHRLLRSDEVLTKVKSQIKNAFAIDGAWIYSEPEQRKNGMLTQTVYRGGVTENKDEEAVHYDFVADAHTGTLLSFTPQ